MDKSAAFTRPDVKPKVRPSMLRILGLDPGLRHTGYGVIDVSGNHVTYVASGVIDPIVGDNLALRLNDLFKGLSDVIRAFEPDEAVVEETFVNKNPASALKLGMARGVVLLAPAIFNIPVFEYTANQIKKSVVGTGHADKTQVMHMVKYLIPTAKDVVRPDAIDALATALCHSHFRPIQNLTRTLMKA